jgi:4-hydroxybenzoate polyprenyltransferase
MRGLVGLLRATHPLPAVAVTALVGVVAAARGASGGTLAWVLASTAAGQASVGWSNDYLDRDRDRAAGRTEKPLVAGDVSALAVLVAALVTLLLSPALSLPLGVREAGVMLVAVVSAWGYNLGLKATALSWLPYAISFGLAPVYVWLATSGSLPPAWIVAGTALLGVAAHLLNAVRDLEADRVGLVRGLPHRLGLKTSVLLGALLLAVALALVLVAGGRLEFARVGTGLVAAVLVIAASWAGWRGRGRLGFRLTIGAAAAIVLVFVLSPDVGLR